MCICLQWFKSTYLKLILLSQINIKIILYLNYWNLNQFEFLIFLSRCFSFLEKSTVCNTWRADIMNFKTRYRSEAFKFRKHRAEIIMIQTNVDTRILLLDEKKEDGIKCNGNERVPYWRSQIKGLPLNSGWDFSKDFLEENFDRVKRFPSGYQRDRVAENSSEVFSRDVE